MLNLTLDKAVELVEQAVASKPEGYKYEAPEGPGVCLYVDYDTSTWNEELEEYEASNYRPGCLVGTALILGGIPQDKFLQGSLNEQGVGDLLGALQIDQNLTFDSDAARYLDILQGSQDKGATWADAHERALNGQRAVKDYTLGGLYWVDTKTGDRVE
jgi:hypothetical protein